MEDGLRMSSVEERERGRGICMWMVMTVNIYQTHIMYQKFFEIDEFISFSQLSEVSTCYYSSLEMRKWRNEVVRQLVHHPQPVPGLPASNYKVILPPKRRWLMIRNPNIIQIRTTLIKKDEIHRARIYLRIPGY